MSLSLNFWIELAAIALGFVIVIIAIPRYRLYTVNKAKAHHLRVEFSDSIKMSLPNIAATSLQTLDEHGRVVNDSTALKFCLIQLDGLIAKFDILYSDEQRSQPSEATEDLILLGERIVEDLRENGLLSTVSN